MGTPLSHLSPVLDQLDQLRCDYCQSDYRIQNKCHNLCHYCLQLAYCPLCLQSIQPELIEQHSRLLPINGTTLIKTHQFEIEITTLGGYLYSLKSVSSLNIRLQYHWLNTISDLVLFRDRTQMHYPSMLQMKPSELFHLFSLPINLQAPRLKGRACAWRFYIEMYPWCLDRPEARSLELLPDTVDQMIQKIASVPSRNRQLYSFPLNSFAKYDRFFFAITEIGFECIQCHSVYANKEDFLKSCLPIQANIDLAQPIDTNGLFCGPPGLQLIKKSPRQFFSSLLVTLQFIPKVNLLYDINAILNSNGKRIPFFIICESTKNTAKVWLCRVISNFLPPTLKIEQEIGHFETQLYMSLHKTIIKNGEPIANGYYWRDLLAIA